MGEQKSVHCHKVAKLQKRFYYVHDNYIINSIDWRNVNVSLPYYMGIKFVYIQYSKSISKDQQNTRSTFQPLYSHSCTKYTCSFTKYQHLEHINNQIFPYKYHLHSHPQQISKVRLGLSPILLHSFEHILQFLHIIQNYKSFKSKNLSREYQFISKWLEFIKLLLVIPGTPGLGHCCARKNMIQLTFSSHKMNYLLL